MFSATSALGHSRHQMRILAPTAARLRLLRALPGVVPAPRAVLRALAAPAQRAELRGWRVRANLFALGAVAPEGYLPLENGILIEDSTVLKSLLALSSSVFAEVFVDSALGWG